MDIEIMQMQLRDLCAFRAKYEPVLAKLGEAMGVPVADAPGDDAANTAQALSDEDLETIDRVKPHVDMLDRLGNILPHLERLLGMLPVARGESPPPEEPAPAPEPAKEPEPVQKYDDIIPESGEADTHTEKDDKDQK